MDAYKLANVLRTLNTGVRGLATLLNTSTQAIYKWPDGRPIPRERQLQLRAKFPRKFPEPRA